MEQGADIFIKPVIMLTLGLYYLASVAKEERSMLVVLAVLFCCGGDTFLMLQHINSSFFIFGLVSFLIAHVLYTLSYRNHAHETDENELQGIQKIRFAFPIVLAGTGLIIVLYPVLGDLRFPVIVYALILVIMVLNALFRYGRTTYKSFWMVFTGAVLFMVSDALLAVNRFLEPVEAGTFWVMFTYISAQFLIVEGLIVHVSTKK
jgi:uncharacterized membrane protein YhhN